MILDLWKEAEAKRIQAQKEFDESPQGIMKKYSYYVDDISLTGIMEVVLKRMVDPREYRDNHFQLQSDYFKLLKFWVELQSTGYRDYIIIENPTSTDEQ